MPAIPLQRPAAPWSQHGYWGQFDDAASLPNVAGADYQVALDLQAGDTAWSTVDGALYVCTDPTSGAAVWALLPTGASTAVASPVAFGAQNIFTTTAVRFLAPGGNNVNTSASVLSLKMAMPRAGVLSQMRVVHNFPVGGPNLVTYTLRVAGAPTALAVSLGADTLLGSNLSDSAIVAAGDLVDVRVTKALALTSGQLFPVVSMRLD